MLNAGLIGYGAIGRDTARFIAGGEAGNVRLAGVLIRDSSKIPTDLPTVEFYTDPDCFFNNKFDLVIEAAGHEAVNRYAERVLSQRSDLVVASVGAFANEILYTRVLKCAEANGKRLIIPSCAIAGLDRIAAAGFGTIDEVTLTSSKPPKAWYGTDVERQLDLAAVSERICIFEGPARESAIKFPESVNVSAALSLAGIGFDKTKVRVFVDPTITQNTHEVYASGKFGEIRLQVRNTPSGNPKTGWIVAMSIAKVVKNLSGSLMIGL